MGGLFGGGGSSAPRASAPQVIMMPSPQQTVQYLPSPEMTYEPPAPQPQPQLPAIEPFKMPPRDNSAEVQAAAETQRKQARFAKGRQSTLLNPAGLEDTATVKRKTLLGE